MINRIDDEIEAWQRVESGNQPCKGANLKDIDWPFVKKEFIPLYERAAEKKVSGASKSILRSLGCLKDSKPTNAGILIKPKLPSVETDRDIFLANVYSTKNKFAEKVSKTLVEGLGERLGETEGKILHFIVSNKFATIASIAKSIGISTTAIENNLVKLKEKGVLRRVGPDKGGRWKALR
jgi:ATP-dependent DNA helicase RecG